MDSLIAKIQLYNSVSAIKGSLGPFENPNLYASVLIFFMQTAFQISNLLNCPKSWHINVSM